MLSYLLLNNHIQAALKFNTPSGSLQSQLINHFNKGNRQAFFSIFGLLSPNAKLQFYIRVYFLIYAIHPNLGSSNQLSKEQIKHFKIYLDSKGAQLARTNQFLEFYALPFIKKPLQHPAFKVLFKRQWVQNLKQKINIFVKQQIKKMKQEVAQSFNVSQPAEIEQKQHRDVKQMQRINKQLFEQLNEYIQKYKRLQTNYKIVNQVAQSNLMESQSKWFQIVKQLVKCSKYFIVQITQNYRQITTDRKFLSVKKRIDKYERFVNRKIQDLIGQSQDISVFDKPSINQLSCTITPNTQKNIDYNFPIQEYIPTNYKKMKENLFASNNQDKKISILKALIWRIIKSKDAFVRRQNIIGIMMSDSLGIRNGNIKQLLSRSTRDHTIILMYYISHDYYGRNVLFSAGLLKNLISILKHNLNENNLLEYIVPMLQKESVRQDMKLEMINLDLINIYMTILKTRLEYLSQNILQNITATLLNFCSRPEGLDKFQKQKQVFNVLGGLLECEHMLIRVIVNGTIYSLLGRKKLHDMAIQVGLNQVITYIIQNDQNANIKQLKFLQERLNNFENRKVTPKSLKQSDDTDELYEQDSLFEYEEQVYNIEELLKCHQTMINEFNLNQKQGLQQFSQVKEIFNQTIRLIKLKQKQHEKESKKIKSIQNKQQMIFQKENKKIDIQNNNNINNFEESQNKNKNNEPIQNNYLSFKSPDNQFKNIQNISSNIVPPQLNNYLSQSPRSKGKPRDQALKKLNQQIRASRFHRQNQSIKQKKQEKTQKRPQKERKQLEQKQLILKQQKMIEEQSKKNIIFNQIKKQSIVIHKNEKSKNKSFSKKEQQQYQAAFLSKPKIKRSPPKSPQ